MAHPPSQTNQFIRLAGPRICATSICRGHHPPWMPAHPWLSGGGGLGAGSTRPQPHAAPHAAAPPGGVTLAAAGAAAAKRGGRDSLGTRHACAVHTAPTTRARPATPAAAEHPQVGALAPCLPPVAVWLAARGQGRVGVRANAGLCTTSGIHPRSPPFPSAGRA